MVKVTKKAFTVIGKEGSTLDGEGFIQKLWKDANDHFGEIALLLIGVMGVIAAVNGAVFGYVLWGIGLVGGIILLLVGLFLPHK